MYYKTVKHTVASEIVFAISDKNQMVWLEIDEARNKAALAGEGSGESASPEKFWKFKLEIVQFSAIKIQLISVGNIRRDSLPIIDDMFRA